MNNFNFALITPSYALDFERCQLLCMSVERFISHPVKHYVIVDQRDLPLFRQLETQNREILTKQSILPWWIKSLPSSYHVWLSLKTLPLRGWIIQQIIKIAAAQQIDADVAVLVDSDVVFVRPFDLRNFVRNDQVRLFRNPTGNDVQQKMHLKWHQSASRLLGLPDVDMTLPDYVGHIITWRRDRVLQMCQHVEKISGRGWIETLGNSWHLGECILYGIFIDRILKEQSGHYHEEKNICHDYWFPRPLSDEQLQTFIREIHPDHLALTISAKAGIPVERYKVLLN
ncbi:MAG: DUF6492 family protein [Cyanobacteriota bacterium]